MPVRIGCRLGPVACARLGEDVVDVAIDGIDADERTRRQSPGFRPAAIRRSTSISRSERPSGCA